MNPTTRPDLYLGHLIITAVEGGSNHWAQFRDYHPDPNDIEPISIKVRDGGFEGGDPEPWVRVTEPKIRAALRSVSMDGDLAPHFREMARNILAEGMNADYDAADADVVMQHAVLGEVIYG